MRFHARLVSLAAFALAGLWCGASAAAQCTGGGNGGLIPGSGAANGAWPTVLPTAPLASTLPVTIPAGNTVLKSLKLNGWTHTWMGDMQVVLQDPAGGLHNVYQSMNGVFGGGCGTDVNGNYEFVDPITGAFVPGCPGGVLAPGTYVQDPGTWPSGSSGIDNLGFESIPVVPGSTGNWTLYVYDWYVAYDSGTLASWELCFGAPTPPTQPSLPPTLTSPANGSLEYGNPVNLTWTSVPLAATYDVDIDGIVTSGVLSTSFAATLTSGAHTWSARGVNNAGAGPWAAPFAFTLDLLPPAPVLISPAGGVCVQTLPVTLTWNAAPIATAYDVDVDGVVTTGVAATSFAVTPGVGVHSWSVRGTNAAGNGPWAAAESFNVPPPLSFGSCATGGPGGLWPIGGVDGTWPSVMPTGQLDAPLAVTAPASATIVAVKLLGFATTWVGDQHFVLEDPAGGLHNVFYRPGSASNSFGLSCDAIGGDYTIVGVGAATCPLPLVCNANYEFEAGVYEQNFGDWPDGSANIFNTALASIPVASGTYVLHCYDWYVGGDDGLINGWELCFSTPAGPVSYCTPTSPGTSHGCVPTIAGSANPDVAHSNACVITVSNVEGAQSGIVFYGLNGQSLPWCSAAGNSFLCVKAPLERGGVQNSGGTFAACDGALSFDWNSFQLANPGVTGQPWSAGDKAYVQGWFRDPPSCKTTFLSEALELTYQP